ncbi:hypothetical protein K503DRAFT_776361 [Rhizopogon vinicolor AM-OR11-026]|uniref:PH domain-containing protein n=1 Tax=Rhizopogon vinicolor AM-OR11-026 TaxID=1314800 RepID=A0A1B7MJD2_9AGAM|nr:hypothetical protein K503DRAFT_776361 [Rhizopogon vinicolor AM-OR11-026]
MSSSLSRRSFPLSINPVQKPGVVCEGWLLKKMQGFARRYFVLDQFGSLSPSVDPKRPIRDQIFLPHAALSTAVGRKDINVDSSNATFHIKCLTTNDFNAWLTAMSQSQYHKSGFIAEDTISELEAALVAFQSEHTQERSHSSLKSKSEKGKHHHPKDVFDMFKNSYNVNGDGTVPKGNLDTPSSIHVQRIRVALTSLKSQHAALLKSLLPVYGGMGPSTARGSPLSPATEEKEEEPFSVSRFNTALSHRSRLAISMSSLSDSEEFLLDEPTPGEERELSVPHSETSSLHPSESSDEEELFPLVHDTDSSVNAREVVRRTRLPSGLVVDEGSLFAILKNNVGKVTYLTTIALPRLCFIAAFAVSGYAHTKYRSNVRMKFLVEKVSHNPVIIAYRAEGKGWELNATSAGKTKFWGESLEIIPLGTTRLNIMKTGRNKPSSFMRNLMMGTKYLEHCGKMTVENMTSGASCVLDFKQSGYWGASDEVSSVIVSPSREVCARIEGEWDEQIAQALDSSHLHVLWRITPFPKESLQYYGFSITNDLEGRLPPTNSRFRLDVRALENGDDDETEAQKTRLEEMQRDRRKCGVDRAPRWFKRHGEDWRYVGGYWEARARGPIQRSR